MLDIILTCVPSVRKSKKILIIRIDALGDFVLFSWTLPYYQKIFKDHDVTLIVNPINYDAAEEIEGVDTVLLFDRKKFGTSFWYRAKILFQLRRNGYEKAIYPAYSREPLGDYLIKAAKPKEAVAFDADLSNITVKEKDKNKKIYTRLIEPKAGVFHEVNRNKEFIEALGTDIQEVHLLAPFNDIDKNKDEEMLGFPLSGERNLFAIAPGAGDAKRMWPVEQYVQVAEWLQKEFPNAPIVVIGGPGEEVLGTTLAKIDPLVRNMINKLTISQTVAILRNTKLFIGNDSGPMHLASACKVPVVEISCHPLSGALDHSNSPIRFGPWNVPARILQPKTALPPCKDACHASEAHCILQVTQQEVIRAIMDILKK